MDGVLQSLQIIFSFSGIAMLILGAVLGIIIGALPGLGPSIGLSLLIPFTYGLGPELSMLLMISLVTELVVRPHPWYAPQLVVPLTGAVFSIK